MNQRPLQRGVYLPPFGPFGDPQVLVDLAVRAEAAGWDGVFLWDHVVSGAALIADCWTSLGAMAAEPHPIPLWMASSTRNARVIERAAACDGIFPMSDHTLRPEELAPIVAAVRDAGLRPDRLHDVAVSGNASPAWERPDPDGVDLTAMAEAGATWWMESLGDWDPLELSMQVVDAGPP